MLTPNTWNHVAVSFDGAAFRFYIGGNLRDKIDVAATAEKPAAKPIRFIGAVQNAFKGTIDEIRLWNRVRSSREIQAEQNQRLTGLEPGLAAYWRFDEAGGDTVFDQTDNGADGMLNGGTWVASDAPIGENAGINRNSFHIAGRKSDGNLETRSLASGLSALLYYQQSNVPSGYDGQEKPLKQSARVMLAFATKGSETGDKNHIASLDFGVSVSGKIAQVPDRLALEMVHSGDTAAMSVNDQLEALKNAEEQVRVLADAVAKAKSQEQKRETEWQTLVDQENEARVTAYTAADFSDAFKIFEKGDITYAQLVNEDPALNFNDKIVSFKIPEALQVTVFEHDVDAAGATKLFKGDTPDVGEAWRSKISGLRIETNPAYAAKVQKALERLSLARTERSAKEILLTNAQAALSALQSVLRNGAEITMPIVHLDAAGLSISGGLLGFAWTSDAPLLFDSATGSLALYFRGADDQFFAAYYTTLTERAKYPLTDSAGQQVVICIARSTDLGMDKIALEISAGADPDTCTVNIAGLEIEETWTNVPRNPERFARVLNGQAGHYENNKMVGYREMVGSGTVAADNGQLTLHIPSGLRRALEKGAALMLGTTRLTVKESVAAQALNVPVNSTATVFPPENRPVFFMEYDYAVHARTTRIASDLFGGSMLLRAVSLPNSGEMVANQRVTSGATLTSKWTAAAPGSTLLFNGTDTLVKLADTGKLKDFDLEDDLTLEAWVRPAQVQEKARIIQHKSGDSSYVLGLQKKDLLTALSFNGTDDFIDLGAGMVVGTLFTLEAWIYPEATDDGFHGILGGGQNLNAGATRPPSLWMVEKNKIHGGFGDGTDWHAIITDAVLQTEAWNHVAATFDGVWYRVFANGILALETKDFEGKIPQTEPIRLIGRVNNFFPGRIDDVRVWKRARSQAEILADMNRRLVGNETGLAGYWHFQNGKALDYSRHANDGVLQGQPTPAVSPLPAFSVFAGVNGKYVQSKDIIPAGNWAHFSAVFMQNYGLQFNGAGAYLDCGKDETLNINTDLTLEAFVRPGAFSRGLGILERNTGGDNKQKTPYALSFDSSGRLVFHFQDKDGVFQTFTSTAQAQTNVSTHVAATRKRETQSYRISDSEIKTLSWYSIGLHIGNSSEYFIYAIDGATKTAVEELKKNAPDANTIRAGSDRSPDIGRSSGPTYIGRDVDTFFNGFIGELRIWNSGLDKADIGREIGGGENGLISWWRFEEREGNRSNDSNGQNHATFQGNVQWVKDSDPLRSGLTLFYNDGGALLTENVDSSNFTTPKNQFALGGLANTTVRDLFQGELEEVRIWKTARTREQIEDNLFRRLNGELDDLIAYYTFDAETQTKLSDNALRGNHLAPQGTANYILSTAPVGDDAPMVRSALAGIRTPFSGFIHSTPAVHEYGDMQSDARGNLIGVFKRCYGFIRNNALNLLTGYKVGDLAVEWIGQVQFAPQLIGFIEGAPPVPSENLTQPSVEMIGDLDDYNEASTVEFAQADEMTYTYSASKEQGFGLEVEAALKFGVKSESSAGGGLVVVAITTMEEADVLIGLKAQFEAMWSWSSEASVGTTRSTGKSTSLELRGRYTSPEESEKEPFGWRRFVPENTGLALVQSETADVFALRLRHNNALISFTMRPNPDIPKDWNILHFPINSRYVKQGTLDGKIGPAVDVDYPNALNYSPDSSYFKPVEAYALKNRIQKEEKALETYYNQFNASNKGRKAYFPSESATELTEADELRKKMRRNLVNNYVWTSDGGLFAETQQTMEVQTETSGGTYEFTGKGGIDLGINFAVAKAAASFELSALFVGQHKLNVSKSKEAKTAFQLNVGLDKVERDLYMRDENKVVLLDKSDPKRPKPIKHPYKVDAYRFMSFFLEENSDHFDLFFNQIVDPIWIEQSDDPAARALREARQEGKKPPCWRIMHRVTYVSRVLPPLDQSAPPSLEKALQTLDIESNYELIRQLEPYVSNKLGSFPEFTEAVRETIRQNLPELQPHTEEVIQYMSLYFGITGNLMPNGEQFGEATLSEFAPNQAPIVNAGLDQIIGLDGAFVDADLEAAVIDDRLEKAEAIFVTWEKTSGPEGVTFQDRHAGTTRATFTKRGRYELKLSANDGLLEAEDALTVIVNERPVISAGANIETNALEVQLAGLILDHGLGDPATGVVTLQWLQSGGLGNVIFEDKNALQTKVTFEKPGNYLLQLLVSNGTFDANAEVSVSIAARVSRDIQALYTFEENTGQTLKDVSGAGTPIDISIPELQKVSWIDGGLKLNQPTLLTASDPGNRLLPALQASSEITLEVWLQPTSANMPGLARILTFSSGPAARNFTLAQNGGKFHLHLRSSTTNDNASNKVLAGGQAAAGQLTQLVCTREAGGLTRMYLDGAEVASRMLSGTFSNWAANFQLALGNEIGGGTERAWLGALHLVAIYSRALTISEIQQNFNFGANINLPPVVSAGADTVVNWAAFDWSTTAVQKTTFPLNGRVTHDRPTSGAVQWKQIGGPTNGVVILQDNAAQTSVEVTQKGRYAFRLTAQDGELLSSDETVVVVNVPPHVDIKNGTQKLALTGQSIQADLIAEIKDSGLGDLSDQHPLTMTWNRIGGPATVQFTNANTLNANAAFSARGLYQLQFTVDNGALATSKPVQVIVHQMPVLAAIVPLIVTLPVNQVTLNGAVTDSGLGNPADALHILWEKISGPGTVSFADASKAQTAATFDKGGVYVLRLTAKNPDNPELTANITTQATINTAPVVSAGAAPAPLLLKSNQSAVTTWLDATISDDGLPDPPGVVALKWSRISGPANVVFTPDNTDYVEVRLTKKGKYVLQLEANDGAAKTTDTVTVIVNTPPVVNAGQQQKVTAQSNPFTVQLKGVLTDSGFGDPTPQSSVALQWSKLTGPGNAVIANANQLETDVALPATKGIHTFQLSADNGLNTGKSTAAVWVNLPATVDIGVIPATPANPKKRQLLIEVSDSGLASPQNDALSFNWRKVTGANPVVFQPDALNPLLSTVTFPQAGNYTLELAVGNGTDFVVVRTVVVGVV